ncbi:ribosome maturation factor RimP [Aminicella lysinilytica]|uniref:ribosome maturation factor RimP n=1 Tax=Aminicella lysinilytica TaxID=433323 RepID=UPI0026EB6539|nr:ribosome maturation factor RimP [Aminicella lysinilytica]
MAKVQIKELISDMAGEFLRENGLELYNTQFKKEGRDWYLRVFIDKAQTDPNAEEEYVSTDDCEKVSRYLSEKLDEADPIQQNYFLEVSSPGMDRELFAQKDYDRFAGRRVEVKLYQNFENSKEYEGTLIGLIDGKVVIRDDDEREMAFPLEQVAKTNLAVVF